MSGWIKVTRDIIDHPYVGIANPKRFSAWMWMLSEARFEDFDTEIGGKPITLKRGQFSHSLRFISDKTGMSFQQVRTFFAGLESRGMCSKTNTAGNTAQSVITICNYSKYQNAEGAGRSPDNTAITQQQHSSNTKNKKERIKEGKKEDSGVSFSAFWDLWGPLGGKVNRGSAEPAWNKLSADDREHAFNAAPSWFSAWRRANPSASPIHASTYLNKRRFEDEAPTNGASNERPRTTAYDRAAADNSHVASSWIAEGRRRDEERSSGEGSFGDASGGGMDRGPNGDAVVTLFRSGSGPERISGGGVGLDGYSQPLSASGHRSGV